MELDRLEKGQRVANYRKLCELLNEPVKNGNSKQAQLKEWERFFSYDRVGNTYVITDIFDTPQMSGDKRQRYIKYVEPLLLHYLSQFIDEGSSFEIEHTYKNWSVEIGLTSGRAYDEQVLDEYDILTSNFEPLYDRRAMPRAVYEIQTLTRQILAATVHRLEKQGTVKGTENYYVVADNAARLATGEEVAYIGQVQQRVLDELQVTKMFAVYMSAKRMKQYQERTRAIYLEEKGWDKVYSLLKVEVTDPAAVMRYEDINEQELIDAIREELLSKVREKMKREQSVDWDKVAGDIDEDELWSTAGQDDADDQNNAWLNMKFLMGAMLAGDIEYLTGELI